MSKHNYSQYYNKNNKSAEPVVEEEVKVDEVETVVEPVVETVVEPEAPVVNEPEVKVVGVIANCTRLNIRVNPAADANIVCVVATNSEMEIDMTRSTSDWYHVVTSAGIEGYCMRKFVELKK